jgi:hypothetical protein
MKNLKMKFPLIGLGLTFLLFMSACSNNQSAELPVNGKRLLLAEIKSDNEITRFEYNADSSVSKIFFSEDPIMLNQNVTYTVKYLSNKRVDELIGSNGIKIKVDYSNISYGLNLINKVEIFRHNSLVKTTSYSYSDNKIASALSSTIPGNLTIHVKYKFLFTHNSANNVSTINWLIFNSASNTYVDDSNVKFQFDDKKNPFSAAGDLMLIFWQYANKNNIIRQESKDMNGTFLELIETNYTYNSFGYPTKAIKKVTEPGLQPTTSQLLFTYK